MPARNPVTSRNVQSCDPSVNDFLRLWRAETIASTSWQKHQMHDELFHVETHKQTLREKCSVWSCKIELERRGWRIFHGGESE